MTLEYFSFVGYSKGCAHCACCAYVSGTHVIPLLIYPASAHLSLCGYNLGNFEIFLELARGDPLERFVEVWLYCSWLLRLRQDFQELVVRQEEEPREVQAFHLQVIA